MLFHNAGTIMAVATLFSALVSAKNHHSSSLNSTASASTNSSSSISSSSSNSSSSNSSSSLQSSSSSSNSTSSANDPATPSGSVKVHVVQVGDTDGSKTFSPDSITAAVGDMVQFHFYPEDHSVAQSTFADPCQPMGAGNSTTTTASTNGFWSGFMPVNSSSTTMPIFSIMVNDTKPIWFYCATAKHCQAGMSGVINAPTSGANTLAAYKAASKKVTKTGIPSEAALSGGSASTNDTSGASSGSSSDIGSSTSSGSGGVSSTAPTAGAQSSATQNASAGAMTIGRASESLGALVVVVVGALALL